MYSSSSFFGVHPKFIVFSEIIEDDNLFAEFSFTYSISSDIKFATSLIE